MLELMCKELGIEIGEEWLGSDTNTYKITTNGHLERLENGIFCIRDYMFQDLLTGKLKPVWKPKAGEIYYIPDIPWENEGDRYSYAVWLNDSIDQFRFKNNLVFRTKEEAIARANEILKVLKNE